VGGVWGFVGYLFVVVGGGGGCGCVVWFVGYLGVVGGVVLALNVEWSIREKTRGNEWWGPGGGGANKLLGRIAVKGGKKTWAEGGRTLIWLYKIMRIVKETGKGKLVFGLQL